ncbi:MAG: formate dehydrogenase accessory sulfurtransferase FdhD [Candidatus Odinarchaeota archaeon]
MRQEEIRRFNRGTSCDTIDNVAEEHKIKLLINGEEVLYFLTYPVNIDELVLGYLLSEGMITSMDDVVDCDYDEKAKEFSITIKTRERSLNIPSLTSGCARGTTFTDLDSIDPFKDRIINYTIFLEKEMVTTLMGEFQHSSEVFKKTGAVHLAGLATETKMEYFYEDIGRHNAVDKCLGKALLDGVELHDKILLSTGRLSSEILSKIIVAGIPIVISRSAPTAYAIELGKKFGVTIIGFCRGKRFNIYSHQSRVKS